MIFRQQTIHDKNILKFKQTPQNKNWFFFLNQKKKLNLYSFFLFLNSLKYEFAWANLSAGNKRVSNFEKPILPKHSFELSSWIPHIFFFFPLLLLFHDSVKPFFNFKNLNRKLSKTQVQLAPFSSLSGQKKQEKRVGWGWGVEKVAKEEESLWKWVLSTVSMKSIPQLTPRKMTKWSLMFDGKIKMVHLYVCIEQFWSFKFVFLASIKYLSLIIIPRICNPNNVLDI